ncbi:MAG: serine/threonine protein kinase [Chloroflexaceae bacterium]|nr:serine/threonine protein kinase [Chloroflexaceae bacterium]
MQIGNYTLGRLIGQGGAGSVYESVHPILNQPVAVKVLDTQAPDVRQAFVREAQAVAMLSHPNIINVFEVGKHQGQPFLVMELLATSLADRIALGPLPLDEAIDLLLPLLDGLTYAHRRGLVHCDLKPANVLLRADGTPVLADFGLALQNQAGQPTGPQGTPAYMAPEQIRHQPLDVRTDIYGLGAMLFELLTGSVPFDGDVPAIIKGHLTTTPPAPSSLQPNIPLALDRLVQQMLAKDPDQRPQTVDSLIPILQQLKVLSTAQSGALALAGQPTTGPTIALPRLAPAPSPPFPPPGTPAPMPPPAPAAIPASPPAPAGAAPASTTPFRFNIRPLVGWLLFFASLIGLLFLEITLFRPRSYVGLPPSIYSTPTPDQLTRMYQPPMVNITAVSNTTDFSVGGVTKVQTPDAILFMGEVRNNTAVTRENISVEVILLDADGNVLKATSNATARTFVGSGERSPFSVRFAGSTVPVRSFSKYRINVTSETVDQSSPRNVVSDALELTVVETGRPSIDSWPYLRGTVRNRHNFPVYSGKVIVAFYNRANEVIGVGTVVTDRSNKSFQLPTGATAAVEVEALFRTQQYAVSYIVYTEATVVEVR